MTAGVYLVTCTANGTKYVGSSRDISVRWWKHKSDLRLGRHENDRWQKTWNKYGADAFEWAVLEEVGDEKKLCEREQHWIDILHPELNVYPCAEYVYMDEKARELHAKHIGEAQRKQWAKATPEQKERRKQSLREAWARNKEARREINRKAWDAQPEAQKKKISRRLKKQSKEIAQKKLKLSAEKYEQRRKEKLAKQVERAKAKAERERKRLEWEAGRAERRKAQIEKLRQAAIAQWADPEYRAKHQAAVQAKMQDPEVLKRLSESHRGKKLSKEHRRKIGESGRGKKRSEETRRRLSEARKAWWARKKGEQ